LTGICPSPPAGDKNQEFLVKKVFNIIIGSGVLITLLLTACGAAPQRGDNMLNVLASTSFLADITRNVVGDRANVESLLPVGADPHAYEATQKAKQARSMVTRQAIHTCGWTRSGSLPMLRTSETD
jgi:hypothetical protein